MDLIQMINQLLYSKNPAQKEAAISFARYLKTFPLNSETYKIFLKLLNLNYEELGEIIFENRDPESFFSIIEPTYSLIENSLEILIFFKPQILIKKTTLACLGVLLNCYKDPVSGFSIHPLKISDLQHIGKYFIKEDQDITNLLIGIMESIGYSNLRNHKDELIAAQNILDYYYDKKKKLEDIIPQTLLTST